MDELLRMMRNSQWSQETVNVPANTQPAVILVKQNERRVALVITGTGTTGVNLFESPAPGNSTGVTITAGSVPLVLSLLLHGAIVKGPIYATSAGGAAGNVSYFECLAGLD